MLTLSTTEHAVVTNRDAAIPPTERLLDLLKYKDAAIAIGKTNLYAHLKLVIQHKKSRRILELNNDLSIKDLKQKCLVGARRGIEE